jgi:long-chain acyl-CoA synthetase
LARSARLAAGLAGLGVTHGDRVALVLRNDIEFVEVSTAVGLLGAIPVPVNWHWKGSELGFLLGDCGASAAFVHTDLLPVVRQASNRPMPLIEVVPGDALRRAYRLDDQPSGFGDRELESWLAEQTDQVRTPPTPPLSVIYTSGTTGQPKGILRQPMTPEQTPMVMERLFRAFGLAAGMRTLVPAPLYHSAPNAHALFAFAAGCELTIMPRFTPEDFLATVERERIEHTQMVPTMFVRLLALPPETRAAYDLSSLVAVVHAAAPCPPSVKREMINWWGEIILEYYGGSETGVVVGCDSAEWLAHPGTVGKALPGCDVKIFRPDGTEAPAGGFGEIYVKPGSAWPDFTYIGNEAATRPSDGPWSATDT